MRFKDFLARAFLIVFVIALIILIFIFFPIEGGSVQATQIEEPAPIEVTEGPAPTALDDEEDENPGEPFICGVPFLDEQMHPIEKETTPSPVEEPTYEPTEEDNGFVLIWDDRLAQITSWERELLARTAWIEDRGSSIECQMAVVTVVLNRYFSGKYAKGNTDYESDLEFICRDTHQFSGGYMIDEVKPYQMQYDAVDAILQNGLILPRNVVYFRDKYYHSFGTPYMVIDHTYFSANDTMYP